MWSQFNKHSRSVILEEKELFLRLLTNKKQILITYKNYKKLDSKGIFEEIITIIELKKFKRLAYYTIEFQLISDKSYFHDEVYQ